MTRWDWISAVAQCSNQLLLACSSDIVSVGLTGSRSRTVLSQSVARRHHERWRSPSLIWTSNAVSFWMTASTLAPCHAPTLNNRWRCVETGFAIAPRATPAHDNEATKQTTKWVAFYRRHWTYDLCYGSWNVVLAKFPTRERIKASSSAQDLTTTLRLLSTRPGSVSISFAFLLFAFSTSFLFIFVTSLSLRLLVPGTANPPCNYCPISLSFIASGKQVPIDRLHRQDVFLLNFCYLVGCY